MKGYFIQLFLGLFLMGIAAIACDEGDDGADSQNDKDTATTDEDTDSATDGETDSDTDSNSLADLDSAAPFAMIELFTSEGCASCPLAEDQLAQVLYAMYPDQRVFGIAWHVDYWDHLGWPDRYGSPEHTSRQDKYLRLVASQYRYTPQLLVNSAELTSTVQINDALKEPTDVSVTLWLKSAPAASPIILEYNVTNLPSGAELSIVLVEKGLSNNISGGENNGRILKHENVARAFKTISSSNSAQGRIELTPPSDIVIEKCSLIGFVQHPQTMTFSGATSIDLVD
ncbi:MAG: DUF1223 domain-containing protein [Proteobacteria bacterium]|nr:DUF1223 domain-containing protein [Pseudomonadota bacterium]